MQIRMDGKLSQTELSSFKLLSIFDLASCFPIKKFLVLGSNAKSRHFQIQKYLANSCCYINVRVLANFHYNPCKYWCFGIFILLQNTCVWLQWLGFGGKHGILCITGFNYQALIRNLLVFQQSPTKSYQIGVFYKHYVHIFGKSHRFPYKSGFWGYFAKGIWQNFAYFPTKIIYIIVVSHYIIA